MGVARVIKLVMLRIGIALVLLSSCAASLPARIQCRVEALDGLPRDPMQVTLGHTVQVVERLRACDARETDGGVQ